MIYVVPIVIILLLVVGWGISVGNRLKVLKVKIDEADGGIDVALTKRYDVLTKMLETVKAFTRHESETFAQLARLRSGMSIDEKMEVCRSMDQLTGQLNIAVENYPELKSSQNYMKLKQTISDTEHNLQAARRFYNSNVSTYNQAIVVFPSSIIAGIIGMTKKKFFEAEDRKRQDVAMNF